MKYKTYKIGDCVLTLIHNPLLDDPWLGDSEQISTTEIIEGKFIDFNKPPIMKEKQPLKKFEIWIGYYHLGQGHHGSSKPELVGTELAANFKDACALYAARHHFEFLEKRIKEGEPLYDVDRSLDYNSYTNSNSWIGKYYSSKEEAQKSFKHG